MAKKKKAKKKKQTKKRVTVKRGSVITAEKIKKALRAGEKVYLEIKKDRYFNRLRELTAQHGSRYTSSLQRYREEGMNCMARSCWLPGFITGQLHWVDTMFEYDRTHGLKISKALVIKTKTIITKKPL